MIDFLEPAGFERARRAIALGSSVQPALRMVAAALALLVALVGVESTRLRQAEERAASRESERERMVRRVEGFRSQVRAVRVRQTELAAALDLRRAGLRRAVQIARVGNALPQAIGLSSLRDAGSIWHLEGRAATMADVGDALARLRPLPLPQFRGVLDVHRGERDDVVVFELELGTRPP